MTKLPDNLEKLIEEKFGFIPDAEWGAREATSYLLNDLGVMECLEFYGDPENYETWNNVSIPGGRKFIPTIGDKGSTAQETLAKINGGEG